MCCTHKYFSSSDTDPDYIHKLSLIKKAKSGNEYFTFDLQTSSSKFAKVVGFDRKNHQQALLFQNAGTPVRVLNANEKDDNLFVNNHSTIVKANSGDIHFESTQPSSNTSTNSTLPHGNAIQISLSQVNSLTRNQRVNVRGTITMGDAKPKEVRKRNGNSGLVKEDCVIEDQTGHTTLHLWDDMIEKCKNSNSYEITDLSVKNCNGHTHLGSTSDTTIKEISMHVDNPKGPQLVTNIQKTVTIQEFIFTDKVSVFMICQINSCKKKMPYVIDSPVFTCPSCGTCQKVKGAKKGATARLCAEIEGKQVWLTAFTDVMENLLAKAHLMINATSDQIKEALLKMENITIVIDSVSNFIVEVKENDA